MLQNIIREMQANDYLIHPRPTNPAIHGGVGYGRLSIPPWEPRALARVGSIKPFEPEVLLEKVRRFIG